MTNKLGIFTANDWHLIYMYVVYSVGGRAGESPGWKQEGPGDGRSEDKIKRWNPGENKEDFARYTETVFC